MMDSDEQKIINVYYDIENGWTNPIQIHKKLDKKITLKKIKDLFDSKSELKNIPIVYNVDFGHTDPSCSFPVGGKAIIFAKNKEVDIKIEK